MNQQFYMRFLNFPAILLLCFCLLIDNTAHAGFLSAISKASKTAKLAKGGLAATGLGGAIKLFKTPDSKVLAITSHTDGIKLTDELGKSIDVPKGGLSAKLLNDKLLSGNYNEIFLDLDTLAKYPNLAKGLNKKIPIKLVINDKAYSIRRSGANTDLMVSENIAVPLPNASAGFGNSIKDTLHFLNRSINKSNIRPLRFDKSAPVNSVKKIGTKTNGAPDVDAINPETLDTSFGYLRGQQALVSGKFNGNFLEVNAGGKTTKIPFDTLREAAAKNKVQLTILDTGSPIQPGYKGLFGKKKLQGLDNALKARTQQEFLEALSVGKDQPFAVGRVDSGSARAEFSIQTRAPQKVQNTTPGSGADASTLNLPMPIGDLINFSNSRVYDEEHDQRIIPWLNSNVQYFMLASFLFGLFAFSLSKRMFEKIWPISSQTHDNLPKLKRTFHLVLKFAAFFLIWLPATGYIWLVIQLVTGYFMFIWNILKFFCSPFIWLFQKFRMG